MQIPFRTMQKIKIEENEEVVVPIFEINETIKKFRNRGQGIIYSSLDVEEWIKEIIEILLFQNNENSKFLRELFLDSSFCMFHTKIQILNRTLKYLELLTGKKRNHIQSTLSSLNKYRNIFAHGKIYYEDNKFYISYFEGSLKVRELEEGYWSKIESILLESHDLMGDLHLMVLSISKNKESDPN